MPENWMALCAAILNQDLSIDLALTKMGVRQIGKKLDAEDIEGMIRLRSEGQTYREIGLLYGLSDHAVQKRIKRFSKQRS